MAKRRAHGEGTIFRKNSGWAAQRNVTLANGKPKRAFVTGKTREEVVIKLQKLIEQENRHIPYVDTSWTVSSYLDYWMTEVQPKRVRETTMRNYSIMIRRHIKPTMGGHKLLNLTAQNVRRALDAMEERGCSEKTRLECLRVLSACLNYAMREEVVQRNVIQLVERPKYRPSETVIWTAEQASTFLQSVKNHPQYLAFLLFLTYGLRRGEVLGLRYSDIDFENGLIHIRQQIDRVNGDVKARDLKTINSRRTLPIIPDIRNALLEHAAKSNVVIPPFSTHPELSTAGTVIVSKAGTPLESKSLERCFHILLKKAGLPRITMHAMRHTAATVLKDLKVPVKDAQLILGHANIATTLNIYQHGTAETHRMAIAAMGKQLLGSVQ